MFSALDNAEKRLEQLSVQMGDPAVVSDRKMLEKLGKELSELRPIVEAYNEYKQTRDSISEAQEMLDDGSDPELCALAKDEIEELEPQLKAIEEKLKILLLPKDPNAHKNIIIEIRAGTGGDEAGLFSADLYRMYSRYAEDNKWKVELMSINESGKGGFKEVIAMISGKNVYSRMKYESGTHRVQRVPETEASGRVHTSACTVAILPEAEEVEVEIDPNDLRIDVFRASGHGGQSVNTTDSAVRINHIPTGIVVSMQDEKSQHKNKAKAMKVLAARLQDAKEREEAQKRASARKTQVGTGDRSQRIRTYNFSQGRITDHRINLTLYKLEAFLNGELDEMVDALILEAQQAALTDESRSVLAEN
jgi:peptide chain release factor 1